MAEQRLIDAYDLKDLMYIACAGQDKEFIHIFESAIDDCPTIDPESLRPVGHWECKAEPFYICSNCKKEVEMFACDDMMDYCPHCGARMEVQDDE